MKLRQNCQFRLLPRLPGMSVVTLLVNSTLAASPALLWIQLRYKRVDGIHCGEGPPRLFDFLSTILPFLLVPTWSGIRQCVLVGRQQRTSTDYHFQRVGATFTRSLLTRNRTADDILIINANEMRKIYHVIFIAPTPLKQNTVHRQVKPQWAISSSRIWTHY